MMQGQAHGAAPASIDACDVKNGIVFCNRKVEVDIVAASLKSMANDAAPSTATATGLFRTEVLQRSAMAT